MGKMLPAVFVGVLLASAPLMALDSYTAPDGDINLDGSVDAADLQCQMLVYSSLVDPASCGAGFPCPDGFVCRDSFDLGKACLPACMSTLVLFGDSGSCTDPEADTGVCLGTVERRNADLDCDGQISSADVNFMVAVIMQKLGGPGTADYDSDGQLNFCDPDSDGDGEAAGGDCDDNNHVVFTTADEICDGIDNNCDELVDVADPGLVAVPCEKQDGVCAGAAKTSELCMNGAWLPCAVKQYFEHNAAYRVLEKCCDGLDNDCDRLIDTEDPDFPCGDGECDTSYKESCVTCPADCGVCTGSCCLPQLSAGCADAGTRDCVCKLDPFCCYGLWDSTCAKEADGCGTCNGNCCTGHGVPGCDDETIEQCVCDVDASCCTSGWDADCAGLVAALGCGECPALALCGDGGCNGSESCDSCPSDCGECCGNGACDVVFGENCIGCPGECAPCLGSCCLPKDSVGCADASIQECVCAALPECCSVAWTASCAAKADECGSCGGSCCVAGASPGCFDEAVEACVCAADSYCCDAAWDQTCVDEVTSLGCGDCAGGAICGDGGCNGLESLVNCSEDCSQYCGNGQCEAGYGETCIICPQDCGACTPGCCDPHDSPGCDDAEAETCVCDLVPGCCTDNWTYDCVLAAKLVGCDNCGPPPACGDGTCQPQSGESCVSCAADCGACTGSCCLGHGGAGCADDAVMACVCATSPGCCLDSWDDDCAALADSCGSCDGHCCVGNGTAGCSSEPLEACVCASVPECCLVEWTEACAAKVDELGCAVCDDLLGCGDELCLTGKGEDCVSCPGDCGKCNGSCCLAHDNYGCQEPEVQDCVCQTNPSCCVEPWTAECAAASDACGGCNGDCCTANETTGCDDEPVELCVCDKDPFCCLINWDGTCVKEIAIFGCGVCGD